MSIARTRVYLLVSRSHKGLGTRVYLLTLTLTLTLSLAQAVYLLVYISLAQGCICLCIARTRVHLLVYHSHKGAFACLLLAQKGARSLTSIAKEQDYLWSYLRLKC